MGRPFLCLGLAGVALLAAPTADPAEPLLFFAEDWESADGDFPAARAAREAFLGYLEAPGAEDFEHEAGRVLMLPLGGYGGEISGSLGDSVSTPLARTPGRRATSAARFYEHGSALVVIELERPVEAVGFYGIDVGDAGGELRVTIGGADGWEQSFPVPHRVVARGDGRGEGAVFFFGAIAAGREIRRVELANVGDPGDGFGYDDLVVGRLRRRAAQ